VGKLQPAVLAPNLDVRMVALVEVVAGGHRSEGTVVEAEGNRGGILDINRLPANDAGETADLLHFQSRNVQHKIEPMDAEPDEMTAAGAGFDAIPLFAIRLVLQPGLIRDDVGLDGVDLAQLSFTNESAGLLHWRVQTVREGEHEKTV